MLGHEVEVVSPARENPAEMGSKVGWVHRLKRYMPKAAYELLEFGYSWIAYKRLASAVRRFHPDAIYERYNLFLLSGLMAKRRFGLPLLLEVNAPLVHERSKFGGLALKSLARWAEGTVWRGADYVLPVTQVLAGFVKAYGIPEERIQVIPNGINEAHFASAPQRDEAKARLGLGGSLVLGFTGFVRDWHGVDRVIRWLAADASPRSACLVVVGDGPARPDLERLAAELGVGSRVIFTGFVPREGCPSTWRPSISRFSRRWWTTRPR